MVVRNKYGGYWNKTRSTVDSGGLSIPCMISMTDIFQSTESPLISPYHAISAITVPTETGDKLMPTQGWGFPGFLPVCMQGTWGWLSSQVCSFPTTWKSLICTHAYDHTTWNNKSFEMRWCYKCINDHTKILCRDSECLPSMLWRGGVLSKTFESFFSLPKILFKNIFELTHISKTVQKNCLKIFQINLKIN